MSPVAPKVIGYEENKENTGNGQSQGGEGIHQESNFVDDDAHLSYHGLDFMGRPMELAT